MNLIKDEAFDLTKDNPGLKVVALAGGWDVTGPGSDDFDLDIFAIPLVGGKIESGTDDQILTNVAYFNNKKVHGLELDKDNRTGEGDGDDETIKVTLADIPAKYDSVLLGINIYRGKEQGQRFGQVQNSFVRLYDAEKGPTTEIAKYELRGDYKKFSALVVGRIYRKGTEWEFEALGKGTDGSILEVAKEYV